jgi:hypothetical protein
LTKPIGFGLVACAGSAADSAVLGGTDVATWVTG